MNEIDEFTEEEIEYARRTGDYIRKPKSKTIDVNLLHAKNPAQIYFDGVPVGELRNRKQNKANNDYDRV